MNNLGEVMTALSTITPTESDYTIPNAFYNDADNDGIDDHVEDTNQDGNADNDDHDGDGIANYLDNDDDDDGVLTNVEGTVDTDNDGISNYLDTDDDNDGFLTSVEGQTDDDTDGIPNYLDNTYYENLVNGPLAYTNTTNYIGDKAYELSNHLGNVLSVISDKKVVAYGTQTDKIGGNLEDFSKYGQDVELVLNGNLQVATTYNNTGAYFAASLNENTEYQLLTKIIKDNYNADIKIEVVDQSGTVHHTMTVTQGGETSFTFTPTATGTYDIRFLKSHSDPADANIEAFYIKEFSIFTVVETQEVTGFLPDVLSYNDYYPYGMLTPGRHASDESYRYGFQGQEKDDELKGKGNSLNYTFRVHDPRVGRFFAIDPLAPKYPHYTPYQFSGNRLLDAIELEGLEESLVTTQEDYKKGIAAYGNGDLLNGATASGDAFMMRGFRFQKYETDLGKELWSVARVDKKGETAMSSSYNMDLYQNAYVVTKEGFSNIVKESSKYHNKSLKQYQYDLLYEEIDQSPVKQFILAGGISGSISGISKSNLNNLRTTSRGTRTISSVFEASDDALRAFGGSLDDASETIQDFFKGTKYTNKVLAQIDSGDFHAFPESVIAFEKHGIVTTIRGGDGVSRQMLKIPGIYRGKKGFFEFIKEADGTINHRLFRPN